MGDNKGTVFPRMISRKISIGPNFSFCGWWARWLPRKWV